MFWQDGPFYFFVCLFISFSSCFFFFFTAQLCGFPVGLPLERPKGVPATRQFSADPPVQTETDLGKRALGVLHGVGDAGRAEATEGC